jgi:S1-C subfamily serine protease
MKKSIILLPVAAPLLAAVLIVLTSCGTLETQEEKLAPRRSADEIWLDDIWKQVEGNPVRALDLIGVYRESNRILGNEVEKIEAIEKEAVENLRGLLEKAVASENWDDAASYSRSLYALGHDEGREQEYILSGAKKKLNDGNNLGGFLAAVQAHQIRPLAFEDAVFFLNRAVELRQRRAAACFFEAAESAVPAGPPTGSARIPANLSEYARGSDSVADMIKGVATVIVDRGFRIQQGRGFQDRVLGTAFFIDPSGLLITNYHVISSEVDPKHKGPSRMFIRMGDGTSPRIPARVIGWDKMLDLALIKTEYQCKYVFAVVDRVVPRVGDTVRAIGSPGGLEKTVTSGIVSALSRRFLQIGDVIQVDAAVNPGNSGGPLVDTSGRLVGIIFAGATQFQGLNFAIPAERLAAALPAMIAGGKAERPWFGMAVSETSSGAEIIYTAPNTPAARHRIPEGAVIKSLNGREIKASQGLLIPALQDAIFSSRPGELAVMETETPDGNVRRHLVMTVPRPEFPLVEAAKLDSRERIAAPLFGMILSPGQGRSYLVRKIVRGSTADEAGISDLDPVTIRGFRIYEEEGYALMDIDIKKRSMGFLETSMQLPAWLDSPDTL